MCQDNYGQFKDWLLRYHKQITEHFHESCVAAEQYYRKVCRGHRNICVVDLGWHGKSIVYLKYFMERKCAMDVRVTGAMIGACDDVVTQNYIRKGLIDTYAFESDRWRSQGSRNGTKMGYRETICTEALFLRLRIPCCGTDSERKDRRFFIMEKRMKTQRRFVRFIGGLKILRESLPGSRNGTDCA